MLAEREEEIAAEEEMSGRPCSWNLVYELMRCNVRSCQLKSDWCWEDPQDGKHYKLREPHIERLIDYVDIMANSRVMVIPSGYSPTSFGKARLGEDPRRPIRRQMGRHIIQ
jgi:hypothetical protein